MNWKLVAVKYTVEITFFTFIGTRIANYFLGVKVFKRYIRGLENDTSPSTLTLNL